MSLAWTPGPKPQMDVWLAWGDSMCAGMGNTSGLPGGYPSASLSMVKSASAGYVAYAEPSSASGTAPACVGPWGLFGNLVTAQTSRNTCVINAGVGSSRTSQWVPGQANYAAALGRLQRAMSRRNTTLRGILLYIGPNDAANSATPAWKTNVQSTLAGFRTWAGKTAAQCPCIFVKLTAFTPTDVSYPGWSFVRGEQDALEDANHLMIIPPSPANREAYNLHHETDQNITIAGAALTAAMGHASWA